jgi:hypothetical protein
LNTWHSLDLGDALTAHLDIERIGERAGELRGGDAGARDTGVYLRHENGIGLHCEVTIFFAPGLADLAREFGATPCDPPSTAGLEPLAR